MTTQDTIRKLRENQQLTQDDMAERLGISKNGYGKIERGQSELSLKRLKQIAEILGVDMAELMNNKDLIFIGKNRDFVQNNYHDNQIQIEKLQLIIKHQEQRIDDLQKLLEQKDELINLLKHTTVQCNDELIEL